MTARVDVSLDNVSLVGEWSDWGWVREVLEAERVADAERVRQMPARLRDAGSLAHSDAWVVDGAYFSNDVELSTLGRSFVTGRRDGRCAGRVEFNPNRVTDRVLSLVGSFRCDHVTRADVALDYIGVAVGDYSFSRPRVKGQYFVGAGGVESLYLGSRSSERFVRVYNKALELGRDDLVLTRVEGVGRRVNVLADDLFTGVSALSREVTADLDPRVAGAVACVLHYPEVVRTWDKRTRKRAQALAQSLQASLSPSPDELYRDSLPKLREWVAAVSEGERIPVAEVYRASAA